MAIGRKWAEALKLTIICSAAANPADLSSFMRGRRAAFASLPDSVDADAKAQCEKLESRRSVRGSSTFCSFGAIAVFLLGRSRWWLAVNPGRVVSGGDGDGAYCCSRSIRIGAGEA